MSANVTDYRNVAVQNPVEPRLNHAVVAYGPNRGLNSEWHPCMACNVGRGMGSHSMGGGASLCHVQQATRMGE